MAPGNLPAAVKALTCWVSVSAPPAASHAVSRMAAGSGITGAPKMADRAYVRIEIAKAEA